MPDEYCPHMYTIFSYDLMLPWSLSLGLQNDLFVSGSPTKMLVTCPANLILLESMFSMTFSRIRSSHGGESEDGFVLIFKLFIMNVYIAVLLLSSI